jgi:hippurate hydrolase
MSNKNGETGAKRMILDGLFEKFRIDQIFALHNWPDLEVGKIAIRDGPVMASQSNFNIIVKGKGGHAAKPDCCVNPLIIASNIVSEIDNLKKDNFVLTVSGIKGGNKDTPGHVPDTCMVSGTLRTFRDLCKIKSMIDNILVNYETNIVWIDDYCATVNDTDTSNVANNVAKLVFGENNVVSNLEPSFCSEDFGFMLEKVKGTYGFIGVGGDYNLHHSNFEFNDDILELGRDYYVNLVNFVLRVYN